MIKTTLLPPRPGCPTERSVAMTPLGCVAIQTFDDGAIERVIIDALPSPDDTNRHTDTIRRIVNALTTPEEVTFIVAPGVTGLRRDVVCALTEIPPMTLASYSAIARMAGHPGAVRAVASAVGANPLPLLVPCHHVVPANCAKRLTKALANPHLLGRYTPRTELKPLILEMEGYFKSKNISFLN